MGNQHAPKMQDPIWYDVIVIVDTFGVVLLLGFLGIMGFLL